MLSRSIQVEWLLQLAQRVDSSSAASHDPRVPHANLHKIAHFCDAMTLASYDDSAGTGGGGGGGGGSGDGGAPSKVVVTTMHQASVDQFHCLGLPRLAPHSRLCS